MAQRKTCGKHVELASNDAVKITQCGCGVVHLTLLANGVTVRLGGDALKNVTRGLMTALDKVEDSEAVCVI